MMTPDRCARFITLSFMAIALAGPAAAQTSPADQANLAFLRSAEFQQLVKGKQMRVTTTDGQLHRGEVASLSTATVTVGGAQVPLGQISTVEKVTHRLRNGILAGGIVGAALGAGASLSCKGESECDATPLLVMSAIGVGLGAGIAALMNLGDRDVIYDAKKQKHKTTIALAPIVAPTRKGVAFGMSWR